MNEDDIEDAEKTGIPIEWYEKHSIPDLIVLRESFAKETNGSRATCDNCLDVTRCGLAYDIYNTDGECLLMK